MPPPEVKARVLAAVAREPAPFRRAVAQHRVAGWSAATGLAVSIFFVIGGPHVTARPIAFVEASAAGWLALAAAVTMGVARWGTMLGRPRPVLLASSLGLPFALLGWHMLCLWWWRFGSEPVSMARGVVCWVLTFTMGAALLAAFAQARRDSDPVHPGITGAAAGAMAGAWASVLIDLHCDCAELVHVTVGHVLPVVFLTGVGAVVGRLVLAMRSDASTGSVR